MFNTILPLFALPEDRYCAYLIIDMKIEIVKLCTRTAIVILTTVGRYLYDFHLHLELFSTISNQGFRVENACSALANLVAVLEKSAKSASLRGKPQSIASEGKYN